MKIYGKRVLEKEANVKSVAEFRKKYPKYRIEYVNDEPVYDWCEVCGNPIMENEKATYYSDGVAICSKC